jgi:hypothetical protein
MPQSGDERHIVEVEKAKPAEINCANDPESFLELEFTGGHERICIRAPR